MKTNSSPSRSFASDNNAGVHPEVIDAISSANKGHVVAYGDDAYTARAVKAFEKQLGKNTVVYFVFGGTGANVLGLQAMTNSYQAVVCATTAHINVDECGAPEKFSGCKLLSVATPDGKLDAEHVKPLLHGIGVEHHGVRSLDSFPATQSKESEVGEPRSVSALGGPCIDYESCSNHSARWCGGIGHS